MFKFKHHKPVHLTEIRSLVVDRAASYRDEMPTVCLDLDSTLLCISNKSHPLQQTKPEWLSKGLDVEFDDSGAGNKFVILPRPGLTELLLELKEYAVPVIYTDLSEENIEKIMLSLSMSYSGDDDESVDASYAYMDIYTWAIEQCIPSKNGYIKSLGHYSEFTETYINTLWMITNKPELVDIPCRVMQVPQYYGDPEDRALFNLMNNIFIN